MFSKEVIELTIAFVTIFGNSYEYNIQRRSVNVQNNNIKHTLWL